MREYEDKLNSNNILLIAGIDEAGRGPIAGPVVAAAVILPNNYSSNLINDSKKLSEKQRNLAYIDIKKHALSISVSIINHDVIDQINILEATKVAMTNAVNELDVKPDHVLIDAVKLNLDISNTSIIKGDQKSISIAAASIIAKVTRDKLMAEYDLLYPEYQFNKHKGYLTKIHKEAVLANGPCEIHRKTFAPIKDYYTK